MDTRHYLPVRFFKTGTGNEPVRDWLKSLSSSEKKLIGEDIKTVQFGWPIGMPLVRKLGSDIWEVRIHLKDKIARVLFTVFENQIVLLHGFIKKTQKTQMDDMNLAIMRLKQIKRG